MFGGIETLLVTLAKYRDVCPDMEMAAALAFDGRLSDELSAAGVPVQQLGPVRASRPGSILMARRNLRSLLKSSSIDVAVSHGTWPHAVFGPAVRTAGIPLVLWLHNDVNGRHWIQRWASITRPNLTICNSSFTASSLPRLFRSCSHSVVHYPVANRNAAESAELRRAVRQELNTPDDSVVLLQVSRMQPWKGHRLLIDALGRLDRRSNWVCWIVGYPQTPEEIQYRRELVEQAYSAGVSDRIRFHETRGRVDHLYGAADIFCQPNASPEPFGIVFVEAMLAALPVVTTAMGGPVEFLDASCGALAKPGDPNEVAKSLMRLIGDASLRRLLGEAGRARAQEWFDPTRQLKKLAQALSGAVAGAPATV